MNENYIKPVAVSMEKELEFYKSECERLKTECKELQEERNKIWDECSKIYTENERRKRDVQSLTRTLKILIAGEGND